MTRFYINLISFVLILFTTNSAQIVTDSAKVEQKNFEITDQTPFEMKKNPTSAMLRSAILPGWGQYYNESYLKIPVIWGTSAIFISSWVLNNTEFNKYDDLYQTSKDYSDFQSREFYRDQRDMYALFMGLTYLLNIVDAYVDAHLFDFSYVTSDYQTKSTVINLRVKL